MARNLSRPSATTGAYGAKAPDPFDDHAKALLANISERLPEVIYFTREDLLHLPCFDGVATITRYRYVCGSVDLLIRQGRIVQKSRTDLCLPGRQRAYDGKDHLASRYEATMARIAREMGTREFTVMAVVRAWKSDQHLTENSKRVAVRSYLRQRVRAGTLEGAGFFYKNVRA